MNISSIELEVGLFAGRAKSGECHCFHQSGGAMKWNHWLHSAANSSGAYATGWLRERPRTGCLFFRSLILYLDFPFCVSGFNYWDWRSSFSRKCCYFIHSWYYVHIGTPYQISCWWNSKGEGKYVNSWRGIWCGVPRVWEWNLCNSLLGAFKMRNLSLR